LFASVESVGRDVLSHRLDGEQLLGHSTHHARSGFRCAASNVRRAPNRSGISLLGSGFDREDAMWKFLERELAKPSSRPTILFMHYPLFLKSPDEPGGEYFNTEPAPRARLLHLLKQGEVKIVLTGHTHRSVVNHHDGILFLTTPPISFGLPRGKQPEGWTLVTILKNGEAQGEFRPLE
jgi:hypothetical protein